MKIAIVCDDLIQWGGAERVFLDVLNIYPNATVYTSVISDLWIKKLNDLNVKFRVSFLQKLPYVNKLYRFYSILYLHILAFESFDFSNFDLVISMSSRYSHFVITKPTTKHICYMHSPARMFWNTSDYFDKEFWKKFLFIINPFLFFARIADYVAAQRVDNFVSNSIVTKRRIKKYYHRDSEVINPCIDVSEFKSFDVSDYFLVISRLAPWKRIDIVVEAFVNSKRKLKIIGSGPDLTRLKKIANGAKNIEFLTNVDDSEKKDYLSNCRALIHPQYEDFGLVPLEAMASGKPVIAYKKGGVIETIIENKTGLFFSEQTSKSLNETLAKFDNINIKSEDCFKQACKFDKKIFKNKLIALVNAV